MSNAKSVKAVNSASHERLEDLIIEAIEARAKEQDSEFRIDEFDVTVRKELGQPIAVDIRVYGMAGNTTKDEFVNADNEVVKGGGSFSVTMDDDTVVKFVFSKVINLDGTDYLVTYLLA